MDLDGDVDQCQTLTEPLMRPKKRIFLYKCHLCSETLTPLDHLWSHKNRCGQKSDVEAAAVLRMSSHEDRSHTEVKSEMHADEEAKHKPPKPTLILKCPRCHSTWPSVDHLWKHLNVCGKGSNKEVGAAHRVSSHEERFHAKVKPEIHVDQEAIRNPLMNPLNEDLIWWCSRCHSTFASLDILWDHTRQCRADFAVYPECGVETAFRPDYFTGPFDIQPSEDSQWNGADDPEPLLDEDPMPEFPLIWDFESPSS